MKPVSPVIPGREDGEIGVAKDQPEYRTLPSLPVDENTFLTRWELTPKERQRIQAGGSLYLYISHFGNPIQPLLLTTEIDFLQPQEMKRPAPEIILRDGIEGAVVEMEIDTPTGAIINRTGMSLDEAVERFKMIYSCTDDEQLVKHMEGSIRSFGFSGISSGGYRIHISARMERIKGKEKFTCGRRQDLFAYQGQVKNEDTWDLINGDRICSYCGSMHPDEVLAIAMETPGAIERSDKGYKWYINRPNRPNASFGGIKYYRQHDTPEFVAAWNRMIDERKAKEENKDVKTIQVAVSDNSIAVDNAGGGGDDCGGTVH